MCDSVLSYPQYRTAPTVPHPLARRVGLFRGVVTGQFELCIIFFHSYVAFFFS